MIRINHEKPKSRSGNRPRDLVRLNKMKRRSWTECSSVRQLDRVYTVTGPCGRPMCTDGPVGSCGRTLDVGNHFGLVLDMSRGGLEGPGREFKMGRNRQEAVTGG
ncbi:hypothetical protein DY000_02040429 [Brassica cretica]|uniref:Uncharacterized protein n=1 Tax=Brassica cretica TaxID=69181 RepID=A0ABQ7B4N5_BRACR|nr:hypothetical protein DY000_02040429 [Brassica cretica]